MIIEGKLDPNLKLFWLQIWKVVSRIQQRWKLWTEKLSQVEILFPWYNKSTCLNCPTSTALLCVPQFARNVYHLLLTTVTTSTNSCKSTSMKKNILINPTIKLDYEIFINLSTKRSFLKLFSKLVSIDKISADGSCPSENRTLIKLPEEGVKLHLISARKYHS